MSRKNMEVAVFSRPWSDDVAVYLRTREGRKTFVGRSITFELAEEGVYEPEPTFSLSQEWAQRLADELWRAGYRPSQGAQSEGVTASQSRHLEDMRRIVFSKLKIEQPQ